MLQLRNRVWDIDEDILSHSEAQRVLRHARETAELVSFSEGGSHVGIHGAGNTFFFLDGIWSEQISAAGRQAR